MKPVTVSHMVPNGRQEVFDFLNAMPNRGRFLDLLFVDWKYKGPASGLGAKAEGRASAPMSQDWTDMEITESEPPTRIVEEGVGANGKRRTRSTYVLTDAAGGGTEISLEVQPLALPRGERVIGPVNRAALRRALKTALRRLAKALERR